MRSVGARLSFPKVARNAHPRRRSVKLKHDGQREFRFGEHDRVWASLPIDVQRRAVEIIRELLRAEFLRWREVKRNDQ